MGLGSWRGRPSWGQAPALHICISALDCRWCRRLVPGCFHPHPRIGVRGMPSITGMTMGQREPHERRRMVGAPGFLPIVWRSCPTPPLDSRFRENDEVGGRNDGGDAANDDER